MSLQASHSYDTYFRNFQTNSGKNQRYQLLLVSEVVCGVPGAAVDSINSGCFTLLLDSGYTREIEWSRLLSASQI